MNPFFGMKSKSKFSIWYLFCLPGCLFILACNPESGQFSGKPNIVFILADDLGWSDLPCYGNAFNEAPALDQLAREGMRFTNAYAACPVCSPTRASIQSGMYPAHLGIIDFIPGHWRPYESLRVPENRTQFLPGEITTLGESMKMAGYKTGYFGKWHLGNETEHLPGSQGYDEWRIHQRGIYYNLNSREGLFPRDTAISDTQRISEVLTDYSVDFIEQNQDRPFFLFLAHFDVHVQLDADLDLIEKYLNKEKVENYPCNAIYSAMVEHIDKSVGRVISTLDRLDLSEKTLVVFFSDNGGLVRRFDNVPLIRDEKLHIYKGTDLAYIASSNTPLRSEKGTVFEGGIREPLIIKWPEKIKAGSLSSSLISSVDFYPTFLELLDISVPVGLDLDGQSFVRHLYGETDAEDRSIFWHYPVYHHDVPAGAIRKGDWKLIEFFDNSHLELYNLKEDIGEQRNLVNDLPEKAEELHSELKTWRISINADMPVSNPDFDEARRFIWGRHPSRDR
jgi:arylsulfatase A